MAITQDYVSVTGVEGNDYKGASFTDGAYTSATKTLTKAGAFAATKVNHWLYLQSNDGGSIVAGYYKVSDVTGAPNAVILATDAGAGVDDDAAKCTQHTGTALLPWRSLQGAFDLCTRNATDGNQVNLLAGTAQVNAAALDLTTFIAGGALAAAGPLIVRGYTAAANDGGVGEIDCGGAAMWAATSYDFIVLVDLEIHTFGDNNGVTLDFGCQVIDCEVHKGASTPSGKWLVYLVNDYCAAIGCHIHDGGTTSTGIYASGDGPLAMGNYVANCTTGISGGNADGFSITGNIVLITEAAGKGITIGGAASFWITGNAVYNTAAGTAEGISMGNSGGRYAGVCINNIAVGWSGVGGIGIGSDTAGIYAYMVGYNAFYNNTANFSISDTVFIDLTANDVTLAADPFTSAANGDFSLTAAGKTALRGLGWPAAYLGAHANTDGHITIGAVQYGEAEAGGGGMLVGNKRANKEG